MGLRSLPFSFFSLHPPPPPPPPLLLLRCDLLVVSGPVPKLVTSSFIPSLEPEIAILDTSPMEQWLFEGMEAMQSLQTLVSLDTIGPNPYFKALDFWTREYFATASGEVLNRL
jgi:hypothetical protein